MSRSPAQVEVNVTRSAEGTVVIELKHAEPLAPHTTFGLGGNAAFWLEATSTVQLVDALRWARARGVRHVVLGGGSNVLVPDAGIDGLVIAVRTRGRTVSAPSDGRVELTLEAGEPWDEAVSWAVQQGWQGLECLSGIPGLVGATPIQNVGAYGQEIADTFLRLDAIDTHQGPDAVVTLDAAACEFAYRDSALKRQGARFLVTRVTFGLTLNGLPTPRYGELTRALELTTPSLASVREAVLTLRRSKSMVLGDPTDPNRRSAGSFFTNPIVSPALASLVGERAQARGVGPPPSWPQADGRVKLAAGWLIEHAGWRKGARVGAVGLSSAHALALVHHGGGSTTELLAFAAQVVASVREVFGIELEREPVLL
jgi:UDP-N-acetylmuramate dehydrogenase